MRRLVIALALVFGFAGVAGARDLEVRDVLWGFDGRVVSHRFSPLSLLIENPTDEPFEGVVALQPSLGGSGGAVGLRYEIPVRVAPDGRRWVQFYPFIDAVQGWVVTWGPNIAQRTDLDPPNSAPPCRVLLAPRNGVGLYKSRGFRSFDEGLFPPSITATDALAGVLLDHDPTWDRDRQRAFMGWLARGGELHILKRDDGAYPLFTGLLAPLNQAGEGAFGAGLILRHAITRWQVEPKSFKAKGGPGYKTVQGQTDYGGYDEEILQVLKSMNPKPRHNWTLIIGLAFVYLLLIGPVNLLLARRLRSFLPLFFSLITVVAFAVLYRELGRRGYGERGLAQTLTYARQLPDGALDVMQWSNVFTNVSERAQIGHAGGLNLYANGPTAEEVPGVISSAEGGRLEVDIPLYASRPVLHRGFLPEYRPIIGAVRRLSLGQSLALDLEAGPGMPSKVYDAFMVVEGQLYQLPYAGAGDLTVEVQGSSRLDPGNALYNNQIYRWARFGYAYDSEEDPLSESWVRQRYGAFNQALIARALERERDFVAPPRPDRRRVFDLFLYGPPPEGAAIQPASRAEVGAALYHIRLLETED